jgi:two-component system cell cycle sensor histidine kinase/response regulator CckA
LAVDRDLRPALHARPRALDVGRVLRDDPAPVQADKGEAEARSVARSLLFDIAHAMGLSDARDFAERMNLVDPIAKLSAGPIHFAHAGWAFVDISAESRPSPDENFYLLYDHPYSFECDSWISAGKRTDFPVCVMNAGYSSGWCEESFDVPLVSTEISCRAKGDEHCRFIMAHPTRIEGFIQDYFKAQPSLAKHVTRYEIPGLLLAQEAGGRAAPARSSTAGSSRPRPTRC